MRFKRKWKEFSGKVGIPGIGGLWDKIAWGGGRKVAVK
jgi:hypothetical protein